jgi:glycosyltransferase involved in cell wall biosynthesis
MKYLALKNYTQAEKTKIIGDYIDNPTRETILSLVNEIGKSSKSITAKLSSLGVYQKVGNKTKTSSPVISVIVPIYNVEKYLERCLDSIIVQTYRNFEIIAVNDGSTDNSLSILNRYARNDDRIRIINQKNKGLSGARNSAIKVSNGRYLIFVDSDDTIEKSLFEDVLKFALANDLDMVTYGYTKLSEDNNIIAKPIFNDGILNQNSARHLMVSLSISPMACNKLYKRKLFADANIYYPPGLLHEDIGTTYKLVWGAKRVGQLPNSYYNWIVRGDSITSSVTKKHIADTFRQFNEIKMFLIDNNVFNEYKMDYLRGFFKIQNVLIGRINTSKHQVKLFDVLTKCQNKISIITNSLKLINIFFSVSPSSSVVSSNSASTSAEDLEFLKEFNKNYNNANTENSYYNKAIIANVKLNLSLFSFFFLKIITLILRAFKWKK